MYSERRVGLPTNRTGDEMKIDERLNNMSKEKLINLIKEIKITCESNRSDPLSPINGKTLKFILRLIKGEI